jgi:hypothetical protein
MTGRTAYLAAEGCVDVLADESDAVDRARAARADRAGRCSSWARVVSVDKAPLHARNRLPAEDRAPAGERLCPQPARGLARRLAVFGCRVLSGAVLALAERWLAAGTCRRFVCTVKFQGRTDHAVARRFAIAGRSCATCSTTSTS